MTPNLASTAGRAVPFGALFALAIGLMLYLTTSLVLGSENSRVFDVSLSLPSFVLAPETQRSISGDPITGSRLTPAAPLGRVMRAMPIAASGDEANKPTPATTTVAPSDAGARKSPATLVTPKSVASKRSHYHDADERSHRLARRR